MRYVYVVRNTIRNGSAYVIFKNIVYSSPFLTEKDGAVNREIKKSTETIAKPFKRSSPPKDVLLAKKRVKLMLCLNTILTCLMFLFLFQRQQQQQQKADESTQRHIHPVSAAHAGAVQAAHQLRSDQGSGQLERQEVHAAPRPQVQAANVRHQPERGHQDQRQQLPQRALLLHVQSESGLLLLEDRQARAPPQHSTSPIRIDVCLLVCFSFLFLILVVLHQIIAKHFFVFVLFSSLFCTILFFFVLFAFIMHCLFILFIIKSTFIVLVLYM